MEWTAALNQAIAYMEENLCSGITVQEIAGKIHISNFHFQRAFSLMTGITIGEYLRSRRLSMAGEELLLGASVLDTALKYGYETPESFSRAFRRFHGVTPYQARQPNTALRSFPPLRLRVTLEGGRALTYSIQQKAAFRMAALTRKFTSENNFSGIPAFWDEYAASGLKEKVPGQFGICLQPEPGASEWDYGIGCEQGLSVSPPEGFRLLQIPAYTWAVFPCRGPLPAAMQELWKRIYSEWLPQTAYELLPDCEIEFYPPGDPGCAGYYSEIWLPVKHLP